MVMACRAHVADLRSMRCGRCCAAAVAVLVVTRCHAHAQRCAGCGTLRGSGAGAPSKESVGLQGEKGMLCDSSEEREWAAEAAELVWWFTSSGAPAAPFVVAP
eukprot:jgi/Ulvmu1/485/UM001_0493.1